jgi:hypothetical protein
MAPMAKTVLAQLHTAAGIKAESEVSFGIFDCLILVSEPDTQVYRIAFYGLCPAPSTVGTVLLYDV